MQLDGLLHDLGMDGWGGLENIGVKAEAERQRIMIDARAEASIVTDVMKTPEGKRLLEWLVKRTLLRPPSDIEQQAGDIHAYALAKARREGQNGVVFMLLSAISTANGDPGIAQVP